MAKKEILGICGSAAAKSGNLSLLHALSKLSEHKVEWIITNDLRDFPLFRPEDLENELTSNIALFKRQVLNADLIVIVTPEYTHNIPAVLKNALEWCTASGEFANKPIIPITFTPAEPRGKYAMESLLASLKTMNAKILAQIPLYRTDVEFNNYEVILPEDIAQLISEALKLT